MASEVEADTQPEYYDTVLPPSADRAHAACPHVRASRTAEALTDCR